ncbi:MFS general substrate transporter [Pluteus cervinus]|uniref:MFS general substrate transporter n=1 Tax=Pluteus cervinus TaxID=181527 RepID=A0ACD3BDK5_9AGAR|nr:MFS general substrate transporter [Pluteus cervinus]
MTTHVDEETPLLGSQQATKKTPLPWFQFSLVLFLQLSEPLTSNVIYPFAPQLIRDIGITHGNESQVGYYVGLMQSLFFLGQACTVLHWSRISDRVGRKPVILSGLFGLCFCMYGFGLSRTFWGLVLCRSLSGALMRLNGLSNICYSMMAEMTDSTNLAQAYAYFPIAWSSGTTLGPMIGGFLSRPAEQFPEWFGDSEFHKKYPYFLACSVPATFTIVAWLATYFFLKETVASPTPVSELLFSKKKYDDSKSPILSPGPSEPSSSSSSLHENTSSDDGKPLPLRSLLTRNVILAAGNYASLSLVDIAYRAIQPVFLSTPIELGGLGLPPSSIGNVLSFFGIVNGILQVFFFARIQRRFGSKRVFLTGIISSIPLVLMFPLINHLARKQGLSTLVWALVYSQVALSVLVSVSYGAIFIFITAASPNRASLGATNGFSQMTVSLMRAIGPALVATVWSLTIEHNYLHGQLVYLVLIGVSLVSVFVGSLLPSEMKSNLD